MSCVRRAILLDEHLRQALRIETHRGRERAALLSDATLTATLIEGGIVDAIVRPIAQRDPELARWATLAHGLALDVTYVLGDVIKDGVRRPRPFARDCARQPTLPGCVARAVFASRYSFYSLHSAMAFTSAGFSCGMHLSGSLLGSRASGRPWCMASLGMAATTGLLRISSDRHYLSDVLIGAAMGLAVGLSFALAIVPLRARRALRTLAGS